MVNDIIEEIKKGLTGNASHDANYLHDQAMKYRNHENSEEILRILSDMTFDLLPDDKKEALHNAMFIGDKRIDQAYNEVNNLFKNRKLDEAAELMSKIEKQADTYFDHTEKTKKYSFRNRFDEYLFVELYKPEKQYERTPFDFCTYLAFYGYILVEMKKPEEAVRVLEKAIKYNPVNTGPRFEMAECYKVLRNPEKLFECVKVTLKIASTPADIARCYCNLGYYCIDIKDYDSAVCFYYNSMLYVPNDNIKGELQHISMLTKKPITPPSKEDILKAFEKYNLHHGPSQVVINMAYSLGEYCVEHNARPEESIYYYSIAYNLTRNEDIKQKIDKLSAQIKKQ